MSNAVIVINLSEEETPQNIECPYNSIFNVPIGGIVAEDSDDLVMQIDHALKREIKKIDVANSAAMVYVHGVVAERALLAVDTIQASGFVGVYVINEFGGHSEL